LDLYLRILLPVCRYCYPLVADMYSQLRCHIVKHRGVSPLRTIPASCSTLDYTIKSLGDTFSISPTLHTGLSYLINPTYYKYPVLDIVPALCSIPRTVKLGTTSHPFVKRDHLVIPVFKTVHEIFFASTAPRIHAI